MQIFLVYPPTNKLISIELGFCLHPSKALKDIFPEDPILLLAAKKQL